MIALPRITLRLATPGSSASSVASCGWRLRQGSVRYGIASSCVRRSLLGSFTASLAHCNPREFEEQGRFRGDEQALDEIVAAAADEYGLLDAQEEVAGHHDAAGEVVEIDALDLELLLAAFQIVNEIVLDEGAARGPVVAGIDRAGVRRIVNDIGDLVALDAMVVALQLDGEARRLGDVVAGRDIADPGDVDRRLEGVADAGETQQAARAHQQPCGLQRLPVAARQQHAAACLGDVAVGHTARLRFDERANGKLGTETRFDLRSGGGER